MMLGVGSHSYFVGANQLDDRVQSSEARWVKLRRTSLSLQGIDACHRGRLAAAIFPLPIPAIRADMVRDETV